MILVFVEHGLGNQMFQYAFGLVLAAKTGKGNVLYDTSYLPSRIGKRRTHKMDRIFRHPFPLASFREIHRITGKNPWLYHWLIRENSDDWDKAPQNTACRLIKEPSAYRVTSETVQTVRNINWDFAADYYVWGFWEDTRYFAGFEPVIRSAFQFRHRLNAHGRKKHSFLFDKNAVAVHIRRGDFLTVSNQSFASVCTRSYYDRAFAIIESKVDHPFYVFFSDDPDYVRQEYRTVSNKVVIEGNPDYIDMQLMSLCRHTVCANSTFSFWGAFLNAHSDKVVVAPKYLYLAKESRHQWVSFPSEPGWILLDTVSGPE